MLTSIGTLSHSFVRREVLGLRALGMNISLFGVRPEISSAVTEAADRALHDESRFLYPLKIHALLRAHAHFALRHPRRYVRTLGAALLNEERHPIRHAKLAYHFLVSSAMARQIEASGADLIHAHFLNVSATLAMYCSGLTGIPYSVTHHSAGIADKPEMIGLKEKLRRARFLCSISNYNRDYLDGIEPCRDKNYVVRCGVDPSSYVGTDHSELREPPRIRLLSMGRFVEKKGFRYLVDAVAQLRASGVEVELRMIGGGPLVDDVKAQIRRLGLEENVTLLGPLPDAQIPEQFDWTDVFVVPSVTAASGEKEGIPGVITEAMLLGVPVIATRHSGIPEHVIHRETGLLVEERAPDEIAAAVEALRDDPDLRRGCMARGRQLALDEFNIHTTLKQKKAVFETYG